MYYFSEWKIDEESELFILHFVLQSLVKAIAKTQSIHAQQVVKNQSGEEVRVYFLVCNVSFDSL